MPVSLFIYVCVDFWLGGDIGPLCMYLHHKRCRNLSEMPRGAQKCSREGECPLPPPWCVCVCACVNTSMYADRPVICMVYACAGCGASALVRSHLCMHAHTHYLCVLYCPLQVVLC